MCSVLYFKGKNPSSRAILIKIFCKRLPRLAYFNSDSLNLTLNSSKKVFFHLQTKCNLGGFVCVCTLLETLLTNSFEQPWANPSFFVVSNRISLSVVLSFEGKCNCKMQMSQLSLMGIICERLRLKRQP